MPGWLFSYMDQQQLIPHLFRTEYRKIAAVLCSRFGLAQMAIAEDIASDTFLTAAQTWSYSGIPANPVAWLYSVAKNKAKNHLQREMHFAYQIAPELKSGMAGSTETAIDLSPENIQDSQLQMMFAICSPAISTAAQIGLALRILCGFGIEEIAGAFLTNKETINKRLFRAKEKLRQEKIDIAFPGKSEINQRLETVLSTLYLLFNEGYYSESNNKLLREDLCLEAMRLTHLLLENEQTCLPPVSALLALMCFHASRFAARKSNTGSIILYHDQDETRWNYELIAKGARFLHEASVGNTVSRYHIEASIAYWQTQKNDTVEKWNAILHLYDHLLKLAYSPVAALNRVYAFSKTNGRQAAIAQAEKLQLNSNPFYFALLGELYTGINDCCAKAHFIKALSLCKTQPDKDILLRKIAAFNSN